MRKINLNIFFIENKLISVNFNNYFNIIKLFEYINYYKFNHHPIQNLDYQIHDIFVY